MDVNVDVNEANRRTRLPLETGAGRDRWRSVLRACEAMADRIAGAGPDTQPALAVREAHPRTHVWMSQY
ncbi:histidine kinase, partial [Escherichia coli]|nr:histidine kinase [Escherichia coli]